jgi:hypothetical protein
MVGLDSVALEEQEAKAMPVQDLATLLLLLYPHDLVHLVRRLLEARILHERQMEGQNHHKDRRVAGVRRAMRETRRQHGIYINMVGISSCRILHRLTGSGYMGGASQGNQGISFGGRRQITSASPMVPSLAEKERKRREKEQEEERLRVLAEEAEYKRKVEREAEEERARAAEERQWEEESRRQREEEKRRVEQQKREWEEQERKWKMEEEARLQEEREVQEQVIKETQRKRGGSDARLQGQYLSQYQAEAKTKSRQSSYNDPVRNAERERVQELERQLEEAKERERQYQLEREERLQHRSQAKSERSKSKGRSRSRSRPRPQPRPPSPDQSDVSWVGDEREYLRNQWSEQSKRPLPNPAAAAAPSLPSRPLPEPTQEAVPSLPTRPLPEPMAAPSLPTRPLPEPTPAASPRPLPVPSKYTSAPTPSTRTGRFLASNPAPPPTAPRTYQPAEMGMTSESERQAEDARRIASQQKTKAGGWASKSLLEREMERDREKQKEWEESQKEVKKAPRDPNAGTGPGASWDVNQYGYAGGDNQGRGSGPGTGIAFGGRRQIIGPRPLGGPR